ncbi:hypothetical protein DB42_CY00060 [Neochlamydia sp. EPS4]|nr:hypothetical protein DB42_CY00060 [Neochlamydia sp. EPS4]
MKNSSRGAGKRESLPGRKIIQAIVYLSFTYIYNATIVIFKKENRKFVIIERKETPKCLRKKKAFLAWVKKAYRPYKPLIMFFFKESSIHLKKGLAKA